MDRAGPFPGRLSASQVAPFADVLPADLQGKTVLDIGCNAGFFSMEMKRRGAERVLGIDSDDEYLAQASFAADVERPGDRIPPAVGL